MSDLIEKWEAKITRWILQEDERAETVPLIRETIAELQKQEWVRVDERLPELGPGEECLWYQPAKPPPEYRADLGLRARCIVENYKPGPRLTTHWKPIEPPEDV